MSPALFQEGFAKTCNQFSTVCICVFFAQCSGLCQKCPSSELFTIPCGLRTTWNSFFQPADFQKGFIISCYTWLYTHPQNNCHDKAEWSEGQHTCAGVCHRLRQLLGMKCRKWTWIGPWMVQQTILCNPCSFSREGNQMRHCMWYYLTSWTYSGLEHSSKLLMGTLRIKPG